MTVLQTSPAAISGYARNMGAKVEAFVREVVVPYERDPRRDHHGAPTRRTRAAITTVRRPTSWSWPCAKRPAPPVC